jgi:hypothetical protein
MPSVFPIESGFPEVHPGNGILVYPEGEGDLLFAFGSVSVPVQEEFIEYTPHGESSVTYKIESVTYIVKDLPPTGPDPQELAEFHSHVVLRVSVV